MPTTRSNRRSFTWRETRTRFAARSAYPVGCTAWRIARRVRPWWTYRHANEAMNEPFVTGGDPLDQIARRHEALVLDEEIAALPEHYRSAILMHLDEDCSLARMAERFQTSLGTVRGRLQRAKKLLATRLRRRGIAPVAAFAAGGASTATVAESASASQPLVKQFGEGPLPDSPIDPKASRTSTRQWDTNDDTLESDRRARRGRNDFGLDDGTRAGRDGISSYGDRHSCRRKRTPSWPNSRRPMRKAGPTSRVPRRQPSCGGVSNRRPRRVHSQTRSRRCWINRSDCKSPVNSINSRNCWRINSPFRSSSTSARSNLPNSTNRPN